MIFQAKVWTQGCSKVLTIPANQALHVEVGDVLSVEAYAVSKILCLCGRRYGKMSDTKDHKCEFFFFDTDEDLSTALQIFDAGVRPLRQEIYRRKKSELEGEK